MKLVLGIIGGIFGLIILAVGGTYFWASRSASQSLARTITVHTVDFPIPFPLDSAEVARLRISTDSATVLARAQAIERGRHLVESRYACIECHGTNFGGGVMVDDPMLGQFLGPNITTGTGSRSAGYGPADWDRIVRHGVRSDGRPAAMPSEDFQRMTDQELADVVAYIRSQPAVNNEVPPATLGPLGKVLVAVGAFKLSADMIGSHDTPHEVLPPPPEVSPEFGRHLAAVCTGCHQPDLGGGKIVGGDPSWGPAANLTRHETGLSDWEYADFVRAMREGKRPDGTDIKPPMTLVFPYVQKMTEVELEALWTYIQSMPPVPSRS
jgi:mono/diheme cytochrome c family protein